MKYQNLTQIATYLQKFRKISSIKRVGDNLFLAVFDNGEKIFFDLDKTHSNIHKNELFTQNKIYKAPFDTILAKRFNSAKIMQIEVPQNNRILHICVNLSGSYKSLISHIYFEFTGRFTNAIITDENGVILEALRHQENEIRAIKVGRILKFLEPIEIREKNVPKIENFDEFFKSEFEKIKNEKFKNLQSAKILAVDKKIENFAKNLDELSNEAELLKSAEKSALYGEILLENLYKLKDFERKIEIKKNGEIFKFEISKPPKISVNEFFDEAKKLRQKAQNLHIQRQNLSEKIEFWQNLKNLLKNAKSVSELEILSPKHQNERNHKEKSSENVQNFYIGEFKISVGKNEKGNEFLLKNSAKNDFWFHLKDLPSAHVIVKTNKQSLTDEIMEFAALICANFSSKNSGEFVVDFTKRANVKVVNNSFVNYINFKTITILKP